MRLPFLLSCPRPKRIDETKIAGITPILVFNLLSRIPLKISSSTTGPKITVVTISRKIASGVIVVKTVSES